MVCQGKSSRRDGSAVWGAWFLYGFLALVILSGALLLAASLAPFSLVKPRIDALSNDGKAEFFTAARYGAIAINARYVEALNLRGELLLRRKRTDEAITVFKDVLALSPNNLHALLNLALSYDDINMLDEAIERYRAAIALYPAYADTYVGLANALLKKEAGEEAVAMLAKAVELNPNYLEAYRILARAHAGAGRNAEAVTALGRVIDITLDEAEAREAQKTIVSLRSGPPQPLRRARAAESGGARPADAVAP